MESDTVKKPRPLAEAMRQPAEGETAPRLKRLLGRRRRGGALCIPGKTG